MKKIVAIIFVFLLMLPAVADQNLNQGSLTLKEKVGQLIMVQFHGDSVTQEVEHWIKDLHMAWFFQEISAVNNSLQSSPVIYKSFQLFPFYWPLTTQIWISPQTWLWEQ